MAGVLGLLTVLDHESEEPATHMTSRFLDVTLEPLLAVPTPQATVARPEPPAPEVIPTKGGGTFTVADGTSPVVGTGRPTTYQVEVESGLPVAVDNFARHVDLTLGHPRGWTKNGAHAFRRQQSAPLRIVLASPATTDQLCAPLQTRGKMSCRNGNVVAINAVRWVEGAPSYRGDLQGYRRYVINHEVGHSLGLNHLSCPRVGADAPVMLQQTLGLQGCKKNPWP